MTKEFLIDLLQESCSLGLTEREVCLKRGVSPESLYYYKIKYNVNTATRGRNVNSKKKRVFCVNDKFFSTQSLLACYWAGFIAADGNIGKNYKRLSIGLATKDRGHLERLLLDLSSNYPISDFKVKGSYLTSSISITSTQICRDLTSLFNIRPVKSLTLEPPVLDDDTLKDAYLIGYIDGDGSIGLYKGKKQPGLSVSILGTLEVCTWIKRRCSEIYGKPIGSIHHNPEHSGNTYSYYITDKSARAIFTHLYTLNVPKLARKWKDEYFIHCNSYTKSVDYDKYYIVADLKLKGYTALEIANRLGVTRTCIYWYYNRPIFKKIEEELKCLY